MSGSVDWDGLAVNLKRGSKYCTICGLDGWHKLERDWVKMANQVGENEEYMMLEDRMQVRRRRGWGESIKDVNENWRTMVYQERDICMKVMREEF